MSQVTHIFGPQSLSDPIPTQAKLPTDRWRRYGFALFATFVATLLHYLTHPLIQGASDLYLATVFLSALYGGLGPSAGGAENPELGDLIGMGLIATGQLPMQNPPKEFIRTVPVDPAIGKDPYCELSEEGVPKWHADPRPFTDSLF